MDSQAVDVELQQPEPANRQEHPQLQKDQFSHGTFLELGGRNHEDATSTGSAPHDTGDGDHPSTIQEQNTFRETQAMEGCASMEIIIPTTTTDVSIPQTEGEDVRGDTVKDSTIRHYCFSWYNRFAEETPILSALVFGFVFVFIVKV